MTDNTKPADASASDELTIDLEAKDFTDSSAVKQLSESQALNLVLNHNQQQTMTNINSSININEFVRASLKAEDPKSEKSEFWKRVRIEIALNFVNPERFYLYIKAIALILVILFLICKVKFLGFELSKDDVEKYLRIIYSKEK